MQENLILFIITYFKKNLNKIIGFFKGVYYPTISFVIYIFLAFGFLILIIKTAFSENFEVLIEIAQMGAIITATLAVLTFTYALTFDNYTLHSHIKKDVINTGKYFYLSCLNFIIGIIFLTFSGKAFAYAIEDNDMLRLVINGFFLIICFSIFLLSSGYFAIGIKNILKHLTN